MLPPWPVPIWAEAGIPEKNNTVSNNINLFISCLHFNSRALSDPGLPVPLHAGAFVYNQRTTPRNAPKAGPPSFKPMVMPPVRA